MAAKVLDTNGLGDKSPSQLLSDMLLSVPTDKEPGYLFREVFLRQLPTDIRAHLAQTSNKGSTPDELRKLAEEADRYFTSTGTRVMSVD